MKATLEANVRKPRQNTAFFYTVLWEVLSAFSGFSRLRIATDRMSLHCTVLVLSSAP